MQRRYPIGALLALGIIAVSEIVFICGTEPLSGLPLLQPTADDAVVIAKRSLLTEASGSVAIIGDSSALHGLDPTQMSGVAGRQFTNLGTLASLTMVGYSQLGMELLEGEKPPSAILLAVLPQTLAIDFKKSNEMGQISRYLVAYGRRGSSVPRYPVRSYADWLVRKHRINSFPAEFGGTFGEFDKQLVSTRGFFPEHKHLVNRARVVDSFQPSRLSVEALDEVISLAESRSIPVMFLFNPKPDSVIAGTYSSDTQKFLAELKYRHPEIHVLRPDAPVWEERLFGTETHLDPEGVARNSAEVAQLVAAALTP
jgi:hypothetical protein